MIAVSVSANAQKETYKQKLVFEIAVGVEAAVEAAVLSITPKSSITCVSFGECAKGNLTSKS
jgi:hypothetical protein